ncbi:MAG: hypothetical protein M3279_00135 [Actinomycetota bacterium]|nr:hypothetical protein [Actinomycetota bacterium]
MTETIRRGVTTATVVAMLAAPVVAPVPVRAGGCAGGPSAETFDVRTKWSKKVYPPGATVEVDVTVLRPAPKDPFGFGVEWDPPQQTPVEDAKVITSLSVGLPPAWGGGYTNADGKLHVKIKLRPDLRGPVYATTRASIIYNEQGPDCTNVEEWGRKVDDPAFEIREG